MATIRASSTVKALPFIIAGPALIGAALGLQGDMATLASRAAVLPAIVIGVALLTLPALYIGAAFFGVAPRAQAVVRSARGALKDMGIIFFGLAAPLVFLVASSTESTTVAVLGKLVVSLGVVLGFRALYVRLFDTRSMRALTLFLCWSLVSFGIGAQLFARGIGLS